ncbi:hypothetical protein ACFE04_015916 [Oxalis oulophora]
MIYAVITTAPRRPNKATTLAAANQQRQRTNGGSEGVGFHDNDSLNRFGSGCSSIGYLDEEGYWLFLSDSCPYERIEAKESFTEVKGSFVEAQFLKPVDLKGRQHECQKSQISVDVSSGYGEPCWQAVLVVGRFDKGVVMVVEE